MRKPLTFTLVIIGAVSLIHFGRQPIMTALGYDTARTYTLLEYTVYRVVWDLLLPALVLAALHGPRQVLAELGWQANLPKGLAIGALFTLPMLVGFGLAFTPVDRPATDLLLKFYTGSFWAGLAEETFYRAFLFGQLYRHGRWPFWLAAIAQGLFFGLGHLYQANEPVQALGIFGITALGGIWFAWLWTSWRNLWVPMATHILMNAWWGLFAVDNTALGGWVANGCRVATIGFSIWLTVKMLRQQGRTLRVGQREPETGAVGV
ncbi:CPBP family intramembrane glutamic endopeptidase [Rudanella lutea]|uniref:CPBP family intramembrane glutamic endopeptidase n=1 Tax=Rudanella lutea TaxID=451374 RepID=UPI00035CC28B|nr:CPBP family intramembrane glutamic endopeptidase [Rudanella lutea]